MKYRRILRAYFKEISLEFSHRHSYSSIGLLLVTVTVSDLIIRFNHTHLKSLQRVIFYANNAIPIVAGTTSEAAAG